MALTTFTEWAAIGECNGRLFVVENASLKSSIIWPYSPDALQVIFLAFHFAVPAPGRHCSGFLRLDDAEHLTVGVLPDCSASDDGTFVPCNSRLFCARASGRFGNRLSTIPCAPFANRTAIVEASSIRVPVLWVIRS